ncbi:retrovirus-related pol polyprotein from transposon TNT 1-94 [Tanacetum coccineum]
MTSMSNNSDLIMTKAVATACYTQNRSTIVKRHLKTPYKFFRGRLPNINFFYVFGCPVFIHNHKDHLGKLNEKADDGYFLGYSLVSKAFRVFNIRRQQTEETYHITFYKSTNAIKFTKTLVDDITIAESERYPPDEYLHHFEPSQRYQVDSNAGEFIEPYEKPESIITKADASLDQNDQGIHVTEPPSSSIEDASAPNAVSTIQTKSPSSIPSMATPTPQDKWSREKHIELVNIVGNLKTSMLTRAMAKELSVVSAHECLFVNFLSEEESKKVSEALKHSKQARLVAQGYKKEEDIDYDEPLALIERLEAIRIFLAFATYMNFTICQIDVKSAFQNRKLKEIRQSERGISVNQEKYVKNMLKKYDINVSSVKTPMVPPNNLGPDLNGKSVNETQYRANPKESQLIAVKRIFRYLKGTPSIGLWYPKCSGFDLKGYSDSDYAGCNMDRKSTSGACQLLGGKLVCWSAKKQQSVAMSSAEAEYVSVAGCCANILWMKSQLTDYDIIYEKVPIFCDNTSAIAISNNPVLHSRTKHIDIRYHFIRDHILKGDIELHFIPTQYQLADIFTKPLKESTFKRLIVELGMLNIDSKPAASALLEEN